MSDDHNKDEDEMFSEMAIAIIENVLGSKVVCCQQIAANGSLGITADNTLFIVNQQSPGQINVAPIAQSKITIEKLRDVINHMLEHVDEQTFKNQMH